MTAPGTIGILARRAVLGRWRGRPQGRARVSVVIECLGALVILGVSLGLLIANL